MDLPIRRCGPVSIVELPGRLVRGAATAALRHSIQGLLDSGQARILLDMTQLTFLDSAGLGDLVDCHRRVAETGGALRLLGPSARILELLDITQLTALFESFEDESAALASF